MMIAYAAYLPDMSGIAIAGINQAAVSPTETVRTVTTNKIRIIEDKDPTAEVETNGARAAVLRRSGGAQQAADGNSRKSTSGCRI